MKILTILGAAVVVASGLAAGAFAGSSPPPVTVSVGSLRLTFPSTLHHRYFSSCRYVVTGVRSGACVHGVVVASYPLKANPELGARGASFRSDGVTFELYRAARQQPLVVAPRRSFPLSLRDFHLVGDNGGPMAGHLAQWELFFRTNGANYWAIAWIGNRATKSERDDLTGVIGSIQVK